MTVAELIAALQQLPSDIPVMMRDHEGTNELYSFDEVKCITANRITFRHPLVTEPIVSYHDPSVYETGAIRSDTIIEAVFVAAI